MKTTRRIRGWLAALAALLMTALPSPAQDAGIEAGFEDDVTIRGKGGSKLDPDFEAQGYTAFGTNFAGAGFVTSGVGQVYIQRNLEVGSNLYIRGGAFFPDGSLQTTAYVTNPLVMLASGECDTNRTDILFSGQYLVTTVRVWQAAVTGQAVTVFLNGSSVTTFPFSTASATTPLSVQLSPADRLGILCTNVSGTILFSFEGRRR